MEDNQIVDLLFAREEQAITALSNKYGVLCKRLAQSILNNEQDAEECVNDGWLSVWNTIPPLRPNSLCGYVCRVVRNIATNRYHHNSALKRNSRFDVPLHELEKYLPSGSDVADECEAEELSKVLDTFLDAMDQESRVLFVRRYFFSDSLDDIAKLTGISKNLVSVRLNRIKKKLRLHLLKEGIHL